MWGSERGQSETIGNVLLIGVVVIVSTIVGGVVIANISTTTDEVLFETSVSVTDDRVEICHGGGDVVDLSDLRLSIGDRTVSFTDTRAVGEQSSTFSPGDCRVIGHNETGAIQITISTDRTLIRNTSHDSPREFPALRYQYYEGDSYTSLTDYRGDVPEKTGVTDGFNLSLRNRDDNFAFNFTGTVYAPTDGEYTFETWSDDGSRLYIDGELVVDNNGLHANQSAQGTVSLTSGEHDITVTQFEHTGQEALRVNWAGPGFDSEQLTDSYLSGGSNVVPRYSVDCTGLRCSFDASETAADESITAYEWTFGDGTTATTGDATTVHTFGTVGTYDVDLSVSAGEVTETTNGAVTVEELRPADTPGSVSSGLTYRYYEGTFDSLPHFDTLTPERTGTTDTIELKSPREDNFAFEYEGYIDVPDDTVYTFSTASDDGSRLYIGSELVVQNDGTHPRQERSGSTGLEAGKHEIRVVMFEHTGAESIDAYIDSESMTEHELTNLTHADGG